MIDFTNNNGNNKTLDAQVGTVDAVKSFLSNVFAYMAGGLAITGLLAYWFGNSDHLMSYLINPQSGMTMLGYITMFAPLAFVLVMSFAFNKLSSFSLMALFILYAGVMGISLSFIFLTYTTTSIVSTFFSTSVTFGIMAIVGYTTKQDLTKLGSILMMALIGIIVASIANIFLFKSGTFSLVINFIGVLVFVGLTAYDVQKLKRIGSGVEYGSESSNKLAIMGALNLYLDFVNLFLMLLRLFGDRK